jgi:hypothetical protein
VSYLFDIHSRETISKVPSETASLIFEESESAISSQELAHFLYLFRAAYGAAFQNLPWDGVTAEMVLADPRRYHMELLKYTAGNVLYLDECFNADLGERELFVTKINKESPLMIWWTGVMTVLVFAVILSGGEVDLPRGKFKLRSLGKGIKDLLDAFGLTHGTFKAPGLSSHQSSSGQSKSATS